MLSAGLCLTLTVGVVRTTQAAPPPLTTLLAAGLTPASAEKKRQAIRESVEADIEAEAFSAAAEGLAENAALLGDPVTFVEAGEMYLRQADKDRDVAQCDAAIEVTTIALDILHFYAASADKPAAIEWRVIDPIDAGAMIERANAQLAEAEGLIEAIETEIAAAKAAANRPTAPEPMVEEAPRDRKPGTALIAGGAAALAVGFGGASMVIAGVVISNGKQGELEALMRPTDEDEVQRLDDEGKRGNLIAVVGAAVGAVGLAVGVPLLILGAKKRKGRALGTAASLRLAPALSRRMQGLALRGRF